MFTKLLGILSPYKLYIYAALAAIVVSGWMWDRHMQYNKGVNACQLKQAEAQSSYWENRASVLAQEGKAALKEEQATSAVINQKENKRAAAVQKSIDLDTGGCVYTPDELLDIQQAIREANN